MNIILAQDHGVDDRGLRVGRRPTPYLTNDTQYFAAIYVRNTVEDHLGRAIERHGGAAEQLTAGVQWVGLCATRRRRSPGPCEWGQRCQELDET
ncbi:hypothetical protein LV779_25570 [Streptomyces thinghirensis]|nr:hypothetical protein [Streptomyces thinghirensis]